jgi:hypothetical protein
VLILGPQSALPKPPSLITTRIFGFNQKFWLKKPNLDRGKKYLLSFLTDQF